MTIRKEYKAISFCGSLLTILFLVKSPNIEYAQWIFGSILSLLILFYLSRLLNLFNRFRRTEKNIWKPNCSNDFQKILTDSGIFIYEDLYFSFPYFDQLKKYKWTDIKTLVAYMEDLHTYDEIYLRILFTDRQLFLINETTPGWYKFIRLLKENIPTIRDDWDYKITKPAFATNMTVLFDKENREDEIAIKDTYDE